MKRLKFDHDSAEMIRRGAKTSTWRLYDDKDLSVNDVVELIDKVDPRNPATWQVIGRAKIETVIEKPLGNIGSEDEESHGVSRTSEQVLNDFRRYYGSQVNAETPIKIVHFQLLSESKTDGNDEEYTTEIKEVKLYADGGSRGNPGPSASGYILMDMDNKILVKKGIYLGVTTNNQAEYQALKLGLEEAQRMHAQTIHVYMDSLLVVNQMLRIFKVKNRDLWPIHQAVVELVAQFKQVNFTHVPRTLNKLADAAVNEALDSAEAAQ